MITMILETHKRQFVSNLCEGHRLCLCSSPSWRQWLVFVLPVLLLVLKMPSKLIRILRITFCYKQLCGRCLVHMTPVVKVVIHCVFALL